VSYEPRHAGGSDGPTAPASTVAQLEACAHGGVGGMKEGMYYAILVDADVGESGHVERVKVRDSDVAGQGIESCMVNALGAMQVPRYIVRGMFASGPVSPGARGAVGNVLVVGAAVNLVPIVIVAAGVTFIVAVTLHVAEETAEAVKRRRKVEEKCKPRFEECLGDRRQPEWNRETFGDFKNCRACNDACMNNNGKWPDIKCPPPGYRPN